jgi:AraC-like DNA-binding protein
MLHTALTMLLKSLSAGRIINLPPRKGSGHRSRKPGVIKGYPLHHHSYAELIQPLSKNARLNLSGSSIALTPTAAYFVSPNLPHSEGYADSRRPYQLLWVVFGPGGINFFINTYIPPLKYQILPEKIIGQTVNLAPLLELSSKENDLSRDLAVRAHFQALMIQLVLHVLEHMDKLTEGPIDHRQLLVDQIREYLKQHFQQPITIQDLAHMARCTPNYLNGIFRKYTGRPIHQYILQQRLETARVLLAENEQSVKQISYQLGFKDPLYFSRLFKRRFGRSPSNYLSPISS